MKTSEIKDLTTEEIKEKIETEKACLDQDEDEPCCFST